MKILHITTHLGGGVGTVVMDWMSHLEIERLARFARGPFIPRKHTVLCLDYAIPKAIFRLKGNLIGDALKMDKRHAFISDIIRNQDIVLVHYWPHSMMGEFLSRQMPPCRMVIWSHHNSIYSPSEIAYPDVWVDTSPIQNNSEKVIWSTGNISRFLAITPTRHDVFNIGYVGTIANKKVHPRFFRTCGEIVSEMPDVHITLVGESEYGDLSNDRHTFVGKVFDVAPYLAEMDILLYMLRKDHYGTSEQVLGEAMAAGVVPVVMNNPCERLIVKKVVTDGGLPIQESGFVALDEADAKQCVHWLYKNPEARKKMGNNAKERAKELYNIYTMMGQWNEVFDDMMKQPKRERTPL